ncbi:unnamed protein product [Schistosoma margrebowiei]|uniref:Uncharacterized protein n=1 Tax=Schistosoma margrebowiei TaxID=48269 RepID=A0A3P8A4W1_9TREM|nr:unnamed protein product [Schistosoma margrebowiei]
MGLVSRMYLHLRVDVHSGTRTHYCSLQMPSRYPLSHYPSLLIMLVNLDNIEAIHTVCTYVNERLINYSPKNQWKDSSKQ